MYRNNYFLIIFLLCQLFRDIKGIRTFEIRWTHANCSIIDANTINLFVCPIIELPKNRGNYLRVSFMSKRNIDNLIMDFRASTPGPKSKNIEFLKFRTDACKLSSFQSKNPMVTSIFKNLIKGDNHPKGCPLKANFTYTMAHFALNPDYFPGYTPEMNFTTNMNLYVDKIHIIYASMDARIVKRNSKS